MGLEPARPVWGPDSVSARMPSGVRPCAVAQSVSGSGRLGVESALEEVTSRQADRPDTVRVQSDQHIQEGGRVGGRKRPKREAQRAEPRASAPKGQRGRSGPWGLSAPGRPTR